MNSFLLFYFSVYNALSVRNWSDIETELMKIIIEISSRGVFRT